MAVTKARVASELLEPEATSAGDPAADAAVTALLDHLAEELAPTSRHLVFDAFRALILRAVACVDRRKHAYLLSRNITIDAFVTGCLLHQAHIFLSPRWSAGIHHC